MRTLGRLLTILSMLLLTGTMLGLTSGTAHADSTWSGTLTSSVSHLSVAGEDRTGYDRDLFRHWVDADGDGCDTRNEVLISEADDAPTVGSGCSLTGGRWYSYYEGASQTSASALDIDHMVALAEAWDSGAKGWSASRREPTPTTSATAAHWSASPPRSTAARATRTSRSGCRRSTTAATSPTGSPRRSGGA